MHHLVIFKSIVTMVTKILPTSKIKMIHVINRQSQFGILFIPDQWSGQSHHNSDFAVNIRYCNLTKHTGCLFVFTSSGTYWIDK